LDAGSWHSRAFAGEPLPTFEAIARYCIRNGHFLNIEIKPTPGTELFTGAVVAQHAARLWQGVAVPPLLTSFDVPALEGALTAQPELPRGLLIDALEGQPWSDWLDKASALQCRAIVCNHELWNAETVAQAKERGFRTLSYTVNDITEADRLIKLGTDGVITDRVDLFSPA
jgi:glycerophosphoryl diester phosphodiesterase